MATEGTSPPPSPGAHAGGDPGHPEPTLDRALELVRFLRAHCPWDREQTAHTLIPYLLEETHEVVDAIHDADPQALAGELGDLLLNLAFQIVLAEEEGAFAAATVVSRLEEKMRGRHPQLFGRGEREGWETLKARERGKEGGVLEGLARGLDPLTASHRIQERVSGVGFDWADYRGALEKVAEELEEVREALAEAGPEELHRQQFPEAVGADPRARDSVEEELGDLLFAVVNLVRLAGAHAGTALDGANRKFRHRFQRLEALARERGIILHEAGLEQLDALWDEIKGKD